MTCAECAAEVRAFSGVAGALAQAAPQVNPFASLRERHVVARVCQRPGLGPAPHRCQECIGRRRDWKDAVARVRGVSCAGRGSWRLRAAVARTHRDARGAPPRGGATRGCRRTAIRRRPAGVGRCPIADRRDGRARCRARRSRGPGGGPLRRRARVLEPVAGAVVHRIEPAARAAWTRVSDLVHFRADTDQRGSHHARRRRTSRRHPRRARRHPGPGNHGGDG